MAEHVAIDSTGVAAAAPAAAPAAAAPAAAMPQSDLEVVYHARMSVYQNLLRSLTEQIRSLPADFPREERERLERQRMEYAEKCHDEIEDRAVEDVVQFLHGSGAPRPPASDDGSSMLDDDEMSVASAGAEERGGRSPAPIDGVTDFSEARRDPRADPRSKPLGQQVLDDKSLETIFRDSDLNPHGRGVHGPNAKLTAANRERFLGARLSDNSLTGFSPGSREEDAKLMLAKHIYTGRKKPGAIRDNDDGSRNRVVTMLLDGRPPTDARKQVLNLIMGRAQGGKAEEAVADCWAKYFLFGCMPFYYVRNSGGLGDVPQAVDDFKEFGERVDAMLQGFAKKWPDRFGWLNNKECRADFILKPRLGRGGKKSQEKCGLSDEINKGVGVVVKLEATEQFNPAWKTDNEYVIKLDHPQVVVALTNGSQYRDFMQQGLVVNTTGVANATKGAFPLRSELTLNKERLTEAVTKQFTPLDLLAGKSCVPYTIRKRRRQGDRAALAKIYLHSAYTPWCWNPDQAYDADGRNAPRLRLARVVDEIDQSRSERAGHKVNELTYNSSAVAHRVGKALNQEAFEELQEVKKLVSDSSGAISKLETARARLRRRLDAARDRKEPEADSQIDARDARAKALEQRRAAATAAAERGAKPARAPRRRAGDESDEEEDVESDASDTESLSGDEGGAASDGDSSDVDSRWEKLQRQFERELEEAEAELEKERASYLAFCDQESECRASAACNHVTGMQSCAAFNTGITATIFGCLQPHEGMPTVLRITAMPTPDAYNDLCFRNENGELRMLINPRKAAGAGDIEIVEAPIRDIGQPPVKKMRNEYIDAWLIANNKCAMHDNGEPVLEEWPNGKLYPAEPAFPLQPREKGAKRCSYRISSEWEEPNSPYPWVRQMMTDFNKACKVGPRRLQNIWERNGPLFETTMSELQKQRLELKRARRVAQGLIISYETRQTKPKDVLIGNLFTRLGKVAGPWARGETAPQGQSQPMHGVSCYNFSYEGVKLIFDPNVLSRETLIDLLNNTSTHREALRNYLRGDPRLSAKHLTDSALDATYINKIGGSDKQAGLADWVERRPVSEARMQQWQAECDRLEEAARVAAREDGRAYVEPELPPKPIGEPLFQDWNVPLYNEQTGEQTGVYPLVTLNFAECKQPRYMATLFTLLDAVNYADDPECMLPMPIVGLTKTIGGRAQRYMCSGHRSRVQVMCHTTDIFPYKRLGLNMADAVQEGFRCAGFDDVKGNMEGWPRQVYVTTKEFTPLIQNALVSMIEWQHMLNEARQPQREDESDDDFERRDNAQAMDVCLNYMARFLMRMMREVRRLKQVHGPGYSATTADMTAADIKTPYKHIFTWLLGRVNRCGKPHLRHSTHDKSEQESRGDLVELFKELFQAEADLMRRPGEEEEDYILRCAAAEEMALEEGEAMWADAIEEAVEAHDFDLGPAATADQIEEAREELRDELLQQQFDMLPMPEFSPFHAPGGDLQQRDQAEFDAAFDQIEEMVRDRDVVNDQYAMFFPHANAAPKSKEEKKAEKDARAQKLIELKHEMAMRGWVPEDGDGRYDFSAAQIRDFKKLLKEEERHAARARREGERRSARKRAREDGGDDAGVLTKKYKGAGGVYTIYPDFADSVDMWLDEVTERRLEEKYPGKRKSQLTKTVKDASGKVVRRGELDELKQYVKDKKTRLMTCLSSAMSSYHSNGWALPDDPNVLLKLSPSILRAYLLQWHTGDSAAAGGEGHANTTVQYNAPNIAANFLELMMAREGAVWQPEEEGEEEQASALAPAPFAAPAADDEAMAEQMGL